jgi:hypothetical protein
MARTYRATPTYGRWARKPRVMQELTQLSINGIHPRILAPKGTAREHLEQALREGYRERDVVTHSVLICPTAWFGEANEPQDVSS